MTRRLWTVAARVILIAGIGLTLSQVPLAHAATSIAPKPTATATSSGGKNQPANGNPGPTSSNKNQPASGNPGPITTAGGSQVIPPTGGAAGQSGVDPLPFGIAGLILLGLGLGLRRRTAMR